MFINKDSDKQEEVGGNEQNNSGFNIAENYKKYLIFLLVFIFLIAVLFITYSFIKNKNTLKTEEKTEEKADNIDPTGLLQSQSRLPSSTGGGLLNGTSTEIVKTEHLSYGQFYEKENIDFNTKISKFSFPINTKTDVKNYHYVNRKFNIEDYIDELNAYGLVIIDNPYKNKADDFYGLFSVLQEQEFPVLISSDFILYNYQNHIKQIFKDIERDFFYRVFFETNKNFFETANIRYINKLREVGEVNDYLLEGERMESAFFAVAIELLKPEKKQISSDKENKNSFNTEEAEYFSYELPDYLKVQVKKEIDLIEGASLKAKSPTVYNEIDYSVFRVPSEYQASAKLNNLYLASKWINNVFPLYHKGDACPDCFMDYDDWVLNFIASNFVAKDFNDSQDIKNEWAKIYKIISYFSGLRSSLTYKQYNETLDKLYNSEYNLEEIFSSDNAGMEDDLIKIKDELLKYSFLDIEGGYNNNDNSVKPLLGLRILTDSYWPNDYIFNQLINPNVGEYTGEKINNSLNNTYCRISNSNMRCRGFEQDIINLIYTPKDKDEYYLENINYSGYEAQINKLKNKLSAFNINSRNNNKYWSNLFILESALNSKLDKPVFAQNKTWEEKEINTALGAWLNLQLPADDLRIKPANSNVGLGAGVECNNQNYIEPNLDLILELKANSRMLNGMFTELGITKEVVSIKNKFNIIDLFLANIESVITKELKDETLDEKDCEIIENIINQYIVEESGKKDININFGSDKSSVKSIDGLNLMIAVNKYRDDKALIFAPIFNFK